MPVDSFSWLPFLKQQKLEGTNLTNPATTCLAISASPNNFQNGPCRAIICTTAGTIDFVDADDNPTTAFPVWAQMVLPLSVKRVTSITTAVIYGLW